MEIKWDVFTLEEKTIIDSLMEKKEYEAITKALTVDSPEKEYWLGLLLDSVRPVSVAEESKVKSELAKEWSKNPHAISSPEDEAKWQEKVDAESAANEEKHEEAQKKKYGEVVKKSKKKIK